LGISSIVLAVALAACAFLLRSPAQSINARSLERDVQSRRTTLAWWIIVGLSTLALLVRWTRISESLWYDEINALRSFAVHGPGPIVGNFFDPVNHIFHTLLTWGSINLAAVASLEISARVPALLFSLGVIPIMCSLGMRGGSVRAGMIASGLSAILPVLVLEGVDARGYSMMIFFAAASTLVLLSALARESPWLWLLYAALASLGVWTHFVFALVPIGHAVWIIIQLTFPARAGVHVRALLAVALAGVMSITMYAPALPDFLNLLNDQGAFVAIQSEQPTLLGEEGFRAVLQLGGSWDAPTALPGLALFIPGLIIAMRFREPRRIASLLLLGVALFIIVVALTGTWVYARFILFAMPGAVILIALAIDALWKKHALAGLGAVVVVIVASAVDLSLRPARQPLRDAVEYVADRTQPGEPVIAVGLFHGVITLYQPPDMNLLFTRHADPGALEEAVVHSQPGFIIIYYPHLLTMERLAFLNERAYIESHRFAGWQDWGQGDVVIYERSRLNR